MTAPRSDVHGEVIKTNNYALRPHLTEPIAAGKVPERFSPDPGFVAVLILEEHLAFEIKERQGRGVINADDTAPEMRVSIHNKR